MHAVIDWLETTSHNTCVSREFTLRDTPRLVSGTLWEPAAQASKTPVAGLVCLGHGASGDRHQQPIPTLCRHLTRSGIACLSIDGPVHGRRAIGDGGRGAFWPEFKRPSSVAQMLEDWDFAIEAIRSLDKYGATPFGYWGLSMGTIYGAPLLAAHSECKAAVLGLMGISGPQYYQPLIKQAAAQIHCPILFIQQLEDELFTRDEYLALFDAFGSSKKRLHANPGLHPAVPMEEVTFSADFLIRHLTGEGTDQPGIAFDISS